MKWSNIFGVARWEFIKTLLSPTFLILTFLIPVIILISGSVGYFTEKMAREELLHLAIVDEGGDFFPYLEEQVGHIPMELTDYRDDLETLKKAMVEGHYDGYVTAQ